MAIIRFDPFRGWERVSRRMNELVSEFEKGPMSFEMGSFNPKVDIIEDENKVFVHAELPGVDKENVKVSVNEDRMLTIKGEKKQENKMEGKSWHRTERSYGNFTRTFVLPENLDIENIAAKYENGVLELTLNKLEPPKPKEVEVNIQ
jgi:HSP20 family protein